MSPRKTILALLLALLVPSALLVSLQEDNTDQVGASTMIIFGYYQGTGPEEVVGLAAVPIVEARCLVRGVLDLCETLGGDRLKTYNAALQLVSVWAALCMIYVTAARLMPPARAFAAVLLAVVYVPWGFLSIGYGVSWPYDLPSLFFASFGLWTVVSRRFVLFAATLVLGTLNKETVVFLLPAYLLAEWGLLPRQTWVMRALILAGLFLVTYEVPRMILTGSHSPAVTISTMALEDVPRWQNNLRNLVFSDRSTVFENVYGAWSIHLLPLLGLFKLPRSLRAVYFAVPVLLVPIFFVGNIFELRLYNELVPLGAIGTVLAFSRLMDDVPGSAGAASPAASHPTAP